MSGQRRSNKAVPELRPMSVASSSAALPLTCDLADFFTRTYLRGSLFSPASYNIQGPAVLRSIYTPPLASIILHTMRGPGLRRSSSVLTENSGFDAHIEPDNVSCDSVIYFLRLSLALESRASVTGATRVIHQDHRLDQWQA